MTVRIVLSLTGLLAALAATEGAWAADPTATVTDPRWVSPRAFGLDIPAGTVNAGEGERVLILDQEGQPVVARVHVRVGDQMVLMLPDGQLTTRPAADCQPTERKFDVLNANELAQRLVETEFPGWSTRQTRFHVYVYQGSEAFVQIADGILKSMFGGVVTYSRSQRIDVKPPEFPLVVIVYGTQKEFRRALGISEEVVAYYDVVTNRIILCEESNLWKVKPDLAIRQTIATIAHEGAHQILHNIGVQQRLSVWPMWLNEGIAEFFAPTHTDHQLEWKGAGEVNDLRMFELEQLLKSRSPDAADGQLIAQTVGAPRLTSTGYAMAWALTNYLFQNQSQSFRALMRAMAQRGPLVGGGETVAPGVIPGNLRDFKEHFGEDLADIERRVMLHLNRQPYLDPFLDWPHFTVLLLMPKGTRPRREAEVFRLPQQAVHWRDQRMALVPEEQHAKVQHQIREFPNRVQAEQVARQWRQTP
ncbi:MAG: DUF1570 domain-containing protein [Planctomycetaceae bacterium]|nr:MAG: DUF1570 domain-containing protein [Planctomycetaceae bacterium]